MHRILLETTIPDPPAMLSIDGEEAAHALRVKRLAPGERIEVLDGHGTIALGEVQPDADQPTAHARRHSDRTLTVRLIERRFIAPIRPEVEVCAATPKGQAVDQMIDQLAQVGAAAWRPLHTSRSVVDPRPAKLDRLERIAHEACKQSGRAWLLRIDPRMDFAQALPPPAGVALVLADASGAPLPANFRSDRIRLLIGPEGGFTPEELAAARSAGTTIARFGPHTMRIETAAVAAAALLLGGSHAES